MNLLYCASAFTKSYIEVSNLFKIIAQFFTGFGDLFPDIKTRRFIIACISLFLPLCFWIFESQTNTFFFGYLQNKVDILKELYLMNNDIVTTNSDFNSTYNQILAELNSHEYFSISERISQAFVNIQLLLNKILNSTKFWKLMSGSLLGLIVTIIFIVEFLQNKKESTSNTIIGGIFFAVIAGTAGIFIPTIFTPIVNYIGYPAIQILFLLSAASLSNNSNSSNSAESQSS